MGLCEGGRARRLVHHGLHRASVRNTNCREGSTQQRRLVAVSRAPPKRSEGSAPGDFPVVEFFGLTGCWNSLDSAVAGDQGLPRRRPPTRHLRPEHQTTLRAGVQARLANMSEAMPEVSNACGGLSAVRFLLRYRLDRGGDPSGG
jgi:hypothetical protein